MRVVTCTKEPVTAPERIADTKMAQHEEFSTEDFLFYAAECHRLAEMARPPEKRPVTYPKWAKPIRRKAAGQVHERRRYLRLAGQTVY
jgi:hypothetical protein